MKPWNKLSAALQAILIAFALQMRFSPLLNREDYKSVVHYLYAQVTGLLGEYSFSGLLLFVMALVFVLWMKQSGYEKVNKGWILPFFFSFCLLMGQSYASEGSWSLCLGGGFRVVGFLLALLGYAILFRYLIALFLGIYQKAVNSKWKPERIGTFLGKRSFRNVFLLLMLVWMPILLLSYPGNLCYDCLGQLEQGLGLAPYSTHHPLLHTLIVSGMVRLGKVFTGGNDFGLFLYVLLQAAALAAALAATAARLAERGASLTIRLAVVCVYVFAPMYSNMASTAVKDVPFMAAVVWYILLLEELAEGEIADREPVFWVKLVLVQVLVGLLRNNGIYMVALTGLVLAFAWGKKEERRGRLTLFLCMAILPFFICMAGNEAMARALDAEKGSVAEMLSVPFQQTARYLQLYRHELSGEERAAIESVLTSVDMVADRYDPNISDPVKALYQKDSGFGALAAYFKVWFTCFFKHPAVYAEAFFAHVCGWFDPGVTNAVRYEAESGLFRQSGLFAGADKLLIFLYRFAEYIPPLALLENVGVYTWLLFILAGLAVRKKERKGVLLVPLFVSLLICMASPCFYLHPRYAYPIMFTIPFLYGAVGSGRGEDEESADDCSAMGRAETNAASGQLSSSSGSFARFAGAAERGRKQEVCQ